MAKISYESYYGTSMFDELFLAHNGIKGQKWGIRRFQYEDGSLTPAGRERYLKGGSMAEGMKYSAQRKKDISKKGTWYDRKSNTGKASTAGEMLAKATERNIKNGKDKPNISALESMTKDASSGIVYASNLGKDIRNFKESNKPKTPITMSDDELRSAINRLNMERQYRDLIGSQSVSTGYEKAQSILSMTGNTLGVVGAGLGIALTVKQLRGK